jgi:phosphopantetheine--protein transferase-like protein
MIGNDIVDLQLAQTQSNWQRKGFLEKQFTAAEQEKIATSKNPSQQVWLFWSMKEAAYKCYTQKHQKCFFAPKKFQCKMTSLNEGFVTIGEHVFYTFSKFNSHFIHTIAQSNTKKRIDFDDFLVDKNLGESEFVKKQLLANFSETTILKKDALGVPRLYEQEKNSISISLTHHGNYGGFAYQEN